MVTYVQIMLGGLLVRREDERGASAVEYGLLVAGIAALIAVIVFALGDNIRDMFSGTCDQINGADAGCTTD